MVEIGSEAAAGAVHVEAPGELDPSETWLAKARGGGLQGTKCPTRGAAEVVRARGKEEVEGVLDAAPLTERQLIPVIKAVHVVVMTCKSSTGCGRGRTSRPG